MTAQTSLAVATALVLAGCGSSAAPSGPSATPDTGSLGSPLGSGSLDPDPIGALCVAERLASQGDRRGAGAEFVDGAHTSIHALAAELQTAGRAPEAARLLESKQRVEAALRGGVGPGDLARLFASLRAEDLEALAAAGSPVPTGGCA